MKRDNKLFLNLILITLILITLTSCAGNGTVTPEPQGQVEQVYYNVPVVKQETDIWCLPASVQSSLKYQGMDISQSKIAQYCIEGEGGYAQLLDDNEDKLGIEVLLKAWTLNGLKYRLKEGDVPIIKMDYSMTNDVDHFYVVHGFNDNTNEINLMCPDRGYMTMSYSELEKLNEITYGEEGYEYVGLLVSPANKSIRYGQQLSRETVKQITDSINKNEPGPIVLEIDKNFDGNIAN